MLQLGLAEALPPVLLGQLLDAVPQYLRTVARPQVEARLDAGSGLSPAWARAQTWPWVSSSRMSS